MGVEGLRKIRPVGGKPTPLDTATPFTLKEARVRGGGAAMAIARVNNYSS